MKGQRLDQLRDFLCGSALNSLLTLSSTVTLIVKLISKLQLGVRHRISIFFTGKENDILRVVSLVTA